jgi:hypothetical protein
MQYCGNITEDEMNDQNYIRKAIVLAEDVWPWDYWKTTNEKLTNLRQFDLNALAAQLRMQVQSDPHTVFKISVVDSASYVEMIIYNPNGDEESEPLWFVANETEEAIAFFKVIVDSKVLETGE